MAGEEDIGEQRENIPNILNIFLGTWSVARFLSSGKDSMFIGRVVYCRSGTVGLTSHQITVRMQQGGSILGSHDISLLYFTLK